MKAEDLRKKSVKELRDELLSLRKEQFNLRMQQATGQLTRHTEVSQVRKNIARVKTVLSEKAIGGEVS